MPAFPRSIGILADMVDLAARYAAREAADEAWTTWFESLPPMASLSRQQRQAYQQHPTGLALEARQEDAGQAYQGAIYELLDRGQFEAAWQAAVAQELIDPSVAEAIYQEATYLATATIDDGDNALLDCAMLALPVMGEAALTACVAEQGPFLEGVRQALGQAIGRPDTAGRRPLDLHALHRPIHPLVWARATLDARYAVFQELIRGEPGVACTALLRAHEACLKATQPGADEAGWASEVRLWPMVVRGDLDGDEEVYLEEAVFEAQAGPAWQAWQATLRRGLWAEWLMPVEEAVPFSLLMHLRLRQLDAADQVGIPRSRLGATTLRLVELVANGQGVPFIRVHLDHPLRRLPSMAIPTAWMGTTRAVREETHGKLEDTWDGA